jgi:cold shock protein
VLGIPDTRCAKLSQSGIETGPGPRYSGAGAAPPAERQGTRKIDSLRRPPESAEALWGETLRTAGFLDFALRSPYTGPVFKLSVRPRTCGAARGAGRSDRRRRSRHRAGRVLPALHPPLGLSSPWDDPGVRSSEDTGMPTGTIARLLIDKGFGFIRDESGIEHFFHRSSVRGAVFELLREGQRVEFTPEESGKGPRAGEVRLIEG